MDRLPRRWRRGSNADRQDRQGNTSLATRPSDLVKPDRLKAATGITPNQMARMEREMENLVKDYRAIEATFGDDVLQLVLAGRYLERLIENTKIINYLETRHPEIIAEFRVIVSATSLDAS